MHTPDNALTLLRAAFTRARLAADPARVLPSQLPEPPEGRLVVVGAGKAAALMAQATEAFYRENYPGTRLSGLVVTRYGHTVVKNPGVTNPSMNNLVTNPAVNDVLTPGRIAVLEAAHPVPDAAGVAATRQILALARSLTEDDMLLCLISGGGSALLCAPEGVTLTEKAALTEALLRSGASITEMNVVRKHLSAVKGGGLARAAFPAPVLSLIISDVAGDDLSAIASGPTVPDTSTFAEARAVLRRYGLEAPAHISQGVAETPKLGDPSFAHVENRLVASAQGMLTAAAAFFSEQGVTPLILSDRVTGEAREIARMHAAIAQQVRAHGQPLKPPCVLLSGGETTVTVRGRGRGGRNCEFALALALELDGLGGVYALAADSDGIDGSEDAAGALVTPRTLSRLGVGGARAFLDNNDAYSFFERAGGLIHTGPTLTNVNDLRLILIL